MENLSLLFSVLVFLFPHIRPKNYLCVSVSCYTREAGVRTLERRIAAVCRAVAIKVLESRSNNKMADKAVKEAEKEQEKMEASVIVHPPEMPIVIDEVAVEDILGVRGEFNIFTLLLEYYYSHALEVVERT